MQRYLEVASKAIPPLTHELVKGDAGKRSSDRLERVLILGSQESWVSWVDPSSTRVLLISQQCRP